MSKFLDNHGNYTVRVPCVHYLDTNGDGTGTTNAVGNYSGAVTPFYLTPATGQVIVLEKLIIQVADKGAFAIDGYGGLAGGIVTNGVTIQFKRQGAVVTKLTDDSPIINNADMSRLNTDYRLISYASSYNSSSVSFDQTSFGTSLYMVGDLQDSLEVLLHDDFTGLESHRFIAYGVQ